MESNNKVRKVFKSKFAFDGEAEAYKNTEGIENVTKVYKILKRNMHIIMEFIPYNLENLIIGKEKVSFDSFDKNKIVAELLLAIKDLHARNIIHNDYKAKNIQITQDGSVRVIDFDLSDFGVKNINKKTEEINKVKYIILQILYNTKYYPDTFKNRKKYLNQIDDDKFREVMKYDRYNLKELQKYTSKIDFNKTESIFNDIKYSVNSKKKIFYLEKQNVKQNTSKKTKKVSDEILNDFFEEFNFKNEEECSSASYSANHFVKKAVLIKTINKKYPEIRAALPKGYQKLPKDKICKELFKLKN